MIINCNKCDKNFNLDSSLIPAKGKLLKCGNCGNEWFFKLKNEEFDEEEENDSPNYIQSKVNEKENLESDITNTDIKIHIPNDEQEHNKSDLVYKNNNIKKINYSSKNILGKLIIFLITVFALIFLIDTFKLYLANFFPNIITILDNLYATLQDLSLFFKDLFN